jgi:hypothetical protein
LESDYGGNNTVSEYIVIKKARTLILAFTESSDKLICRRFSL